MRTRAWLAGLALLGGGSAAQAATITPDTFSATIGVGESVTVEKTVTIEAGDVASKVDFYFLSDNNGSMTGVIDNVKSVAGDLLTALNAEYGDAAFGVGRYFGDPSETGEDGNTAYDVLQTSTTDSTA